MKKSFKIVKFAKTHIEDALKIARDNYVEECACVPSLPKDAKLPGLDEFVENKLGVAAIENGKLIGYLCCYTPWDNFFGTSRGTFSQVHSHGAVKNNRGEIYSRMYQAAAGTWVEKGILSHAFGVYSHDRETLESFIWNGFGYRTVDAMMLLESIETVSANVECKFSELDKDRYAEIHPMQNKLIGHLNASPMFIAYKEIDEEYFLQTVKKQNARLFTAEIQGKIISYIKITEDGESFVGDDPGVINICGSYMEEEYRGSGIYINLLSFMIEALKAENYTRLGVDFETFNPAARGFWMKYFTSYIYGVTRRIDERIMDIK